MRTQLPGYSPLTWGSVARASLAALTGRAEAHGDLLAGYLRATFKADETLLTGSGTQALQTAIALARAVTGTGPDAPVALPAYSCFDLVTAAVGADAPVVFYDLNPETLSPDPASLERALALRPFAVVGANLYGFPLDWGLLRRVASEGDAVLIEDAAQGLGSAWRDESGGSFGELTVLSFARGKGWTGGGGGALLGRGRLAAALGEAAVDLGASSPGLGLGRAAASAAQWALGRPALYAFPRRLPGLALGETVYHPPTPTAPASLFHRSLAWATRSLAAEEIPTRRANAEKLRDLLGRALPAGGEAAGPAPPSPVDGGTSAYLRFPVLLSSHATELTDARAAIRAGVASGYPRRLPDLDGVRKVGPVAPSDTPGASALADRLVTLPTHGMVTGRDMARAVLALSDFEAGRR